MRAGRSAFGEAVLRCPNCRILGVAGIAFCDEHRARPKATTPTIYTLAGSTLIRGLYR